MSSDQVNFHEEAIIRAFVLKDRRPRCLYLLAHDREAFTFKLDHFPWLDERFAKPLRGNDLSLEGICKFLQQRGAGKKVYLISSEGRWDQEEMLLEAAIQLVRNAGFGTFVSCIPGRLAYFEDEDKCLILEHPGQS